MLHLLTCEIELLTRVYAIAQAVWNEEYQEYGTWAMGTDGQYVWYPSEVRNFVCCHASCSACPLTVEHRSQGLACARLSEGMPGVNLCVLSLQSNPSG